MLRPRTLTEVLQSIIPWFTNWRASGSNLDQVADEIRRRAEATNNVLVRIAFFGQPGAGKSSLINALTGSAIARVSENTDETRETEECPYQGLVLVDLPGYGTRGFPAQGYFEKFGIAQFDIVLCVSAGKFSGADTEFFQKLQEIKKPCIFVRNKVDALFHRVYTKAQLQQQIADDLARQLGRSAKVIFTSCATGEGLAELDADIAASLDGVKRDRFFRDAKAYSQGFLQKKRDACERYSTLVSAAAASVNLVPVPGVGFAADLGAIVSLFAYIRSSFGLDEQTLFQIQLLYPHLAPIAKEMIQYISQRGAALLLSKFSGRVLAAEAASFAPIVGSAIAASASFLTIKLTTNKFIDDCYTLAEARLSQGLKDGCE